MELGLDKQLRFDSFSAAVFAFELSLGFHFLSPARWLIARRSLRLQTWFNSS